MLNCVANANDAVTPELRAITYDLYGTKEISNGGLTQSLGNHFGDAIARHEDDHLLGRPHDCPSLEEPMTERDDLDDFIVDLTAARPNRKDGDFLIVPARTDGPVYRPRGRSEAYENQLVAILPDQQVQGYGAGYDPKLHEVVCEWLALNKPDRIVLSGDLFDPIALSRHETRMAWMKALNDTVGAAYSVLRDYVASADGAEIDYVPGNHEAWLKKYIVKNCPEFYHLTRAGENVPILSLPYLLRLDELGIRWHGGNEVYYDDWPHTQIALSNKVAVRHGWLARRGSGATARATLDHLGHSVVVGHTHRMGVVYETKHQIDGSLRTLVAVEAGTLAQVKGGLGYAPAPDWQQGFATVRIHADGSFHTSLAPYVNEALLWEGQRYTWQMGGVRVAA